MSTNNEPLCHVTLKHHFGKSCYAFAKAIGHVVSEDAFVVLIRALKVKPLATVEDLSKVCAAELNEQVPDDVIELAVTLHGLLGPEWHVTALHFYLLDMNDGARDDIQEECPLYGDDIEEVRDYWERTFNQFDAKRAQEEAAARAWLERRARKAA